MKGFAEPGSHGAQGDPATPAPSPSPGHETAPGPALVTRAEAKALRPRIGGILVHRLERFRAEAEKRLLKAVRAVSLRDYAFMTDDELDNATLNGKPLTQRQKRIAREWERSKKDAAIALHADHEMVINALRAQQAQPGVTVNVERAVIRVPDTKPDADEDAIVIDVEATLAPG